MAYDSVPGGVWLWLRPTSVHLEMEYRAETELSYPNEQSRDDSVSYVTDVRSVT